MNPTPDGELSDTRTAKQYMYEHRDKIMVLQRAEGIAPLSTDFCTVESVGTHPTGLFVTVVFEQRRRQHLRTKELRRATEQEIATRQV